MISTTSKRQPLTDLQRCKSDFVGIYANKNGFVRADKAKAEGYRLPDGDIPQPTICPYCGKERYYYGMVMFGLKIVFRWTDRPEACTCAKGQAEERAIRAAKEKAEQELEKEKRNREMAERVSKLADQSGMRARFLTRTFDRFVVCEGNKTAYNAAKMYADNFADMLPQKGVEGKYKPPTAERNGLFITGSYGTGKTHLAAAIANQLIGQNIPVICMTMIDLLAKIKSTFDNAQNFGNIETEESIMRIYEKVPLLIIDDIGSEQPTEWGIAKIYAIINARYEAYMPVIITTNYGGAELVTRMTPKSGDSRNAEKTLDRLKEMCVGIAMDGKSRRSK